MPIRIKRALILQQQPFLRTLGHIWPRMRGPKTPRMSLSTTNLTTASTAAASEANVATVPCVLNGKPVFSSRNVPVYSHNGQVVAQYSPLDHTGPKPPKISDICEDSHHGFLQWSQLPAHQRRDILLSAANLIHENAQSYIDSHRAIGGPEAFARFGVDGAVAACKEYALQMTRPLGQSLVTHSADLALSELTPMGSVLAIAAWNAPTILWARAVVAPLAAGCSVVLKASEKAPVTPYLLTQHLLQAGVPSMALQLVYVEPKDTEATVAAFIGNRRIRKINFTGSTAVGRQIAVEAARHLKPVLLELGGKNVAVVMEGADLPRAAATLAASAWLHKGQICMCVDSIYVAEAIYHDFLNALRHEAPKVALDPDLALNQRDPTAAEKVHALVEDAVAHGARVFYGSLSKEGPSNCSPTILTDVLDELALAQTESFGPVFSVAPFADLDGVIARINDQPHGLKASVWNSDVVAALDVARRLKFGGVHVNGSTVHDEATVPHGGVKDSGYGRFNSVWGIEEFCYTKAITVAR